MVKYSVVSNIGVELIKHSKLCKRFNQLSNVSLFIIYIDIYIERERESQFVLNEGQFTLIIAANSYEPEMGLLRKTMKQV